MTTNRQEQLCWQEQAAGLITCCTATLLELASSRLVVTSAARASACGSRWLVVALGPSCVALSACWYLSFARRTRLLSPSLFLQPVNFCSNGSVLPPPLSLFPLLPSLPPITFDSPSLSCRSPSLNGPLPSREARFLSKLQPSPLRRQTLFAHHEGHFQGASLSPRLQPDEAATLPLAPPPLEHTPTRLLWHCTRLPSISLGSETAKVHPRGRRLREGTSTPRHLHPPPLRPGPEKLTTDAR